MAMVSAALAETATARGWDHALTHLAVAVVTPTGHLPPLVEGAGMPFSEREVGDCDQVADRDGHERILIGTVAQLALCISAPTHHSAVGHDGAGVKAAKGNGLEILESFDLDRLIYLAPALGVPQLAMKI